VLADTQARLRGRAARSQNRAGRTTFSAKNVPSTTPRQTDRDQQSSFGFQDVITAYPVRILGRL
jgi:hypothetical protein